MQYGISTRINFQTNFCTYTSLLDKYFETETCSYKFKKSFKTSWPCMSLFPFLLWEHLNHWDSISLLKVSNFFVMICNKLTTYVVKSLSQYDHELSQMALLPLTLHSSPSTSGSISHSIQCTVVLHFECDNKICVTDLCKPLRTVATHCPTCMWHSIVQPTAWHRTRCQWHWDLHAMVVNGELCPWSLGTSSRTYLLHLSLCSFIRA